MVGPVYVNMLTEVTKIDTYVVWEYRAIVKSNADKMQRRFVLHDTAAEVPAKRISLPIRRMSAAHLSATDRTATVIVAGCPAQVGNKLHGTTEHGRMGRGSG